MSDSEPTVSSVDNHFLAQPFSHNQEFNSNYDDVMDSGNGSSSSLFNYDDIFHTTVSISEAAVTNKMPTYYSTAYRAVGCLFVGIIFFVGLVGNSMVVLVVWRTRSMRTPTNCYLVSLAVADILLLITASLPTLIEFFLIADQSVFGRIGCVIMVFSQYLFVNVSAMSITAFTVERYIAICHVMRAQTMCTVRRAKRIILALWIFGIVYGSPWLGLVTTKTVKFADGSEIEQCTFSIERHLYLTYYMADLILFYVIPLLLTCVLYGLIARILFTSARSATSAAASSSGTPEHHQNVSSGDKRLRVGGGGGGGGCGSGGGTADRKKNSALVPRRCTARPGNGSTNSRSSRIQVTKMLAVVVCVFAALWLPYRVFVVYNSFARQKCTDLWLLLFCRLMVYTNSAINPILYNAMSAKFCRAFRRLLLCGRAPNLTTTTAGGTTLAGQGAIGAESTLLAGGSRTVSPALGPGTTSAGVKKRQDWKTGGGSGVLHLTGTSPGGSTADCLDHQVLMSISNGQSDRLILHSRSSSSQWN